MEEVSFLIFKTGKTHLDFEFVEYGYKAPGKALDFLTVAVLRTTARDNSSANSSPQDTIRGN